MSFISICLFEFINCPASFILCNKLEGGFSCFSMPQAGNREQFCFSSPSLMEVQSHNNVFLQELDWSDTLYLLFSQVLNHLELCSC